MSLSDIPDDILGLISALLNGFDNCFLWMASDSKLKQRLVNNVITDFHIHYTTPGRILWPGNFLKKLKRLSRLSLVVADNLRKIPVENVRFFPIETLKSFEMICPGILDIFNETRLVEAFNVIAQHFGIQGSLFKGSKYAPLDFYYPNLEHLKVSSQSYLPIRFFIDLPRKLKTLSIPLTDLEIDKQDKMKGIDSTIAALPRTLTSLELANSGPLQVIDAYFFPPNLTSLTLYSAIGSVSYDCLPKSLTYLDTYDTFYNLELLAPYLPPGLQTLKIYSCYFDSACLSHLKHLTSFHWTKSYQYSGPQPPLKLTSFRHGLLELSLHMEDDFDSEFFENLPQTLTKLDLGYETVSENDLFEIMQYFAFLPKNLISLKSNIPIMENLSLLPQTLTSLNLDCGEIAEIYFDRLPPKLKELTLMEADAPKSILMDLPQTLEHLEMVLLSPVDDDIIGHLPKGLKYLSLEAELFTDGTASHWPPNLEHLCIYGCEQLVGGAIAQLPRSLNYLRLHQGANLTDDCIQHMPPNLTELYMQDCKHITPKCSKYLPRNLTYFSTESYKDWVPDQLEDPPKYLVVI